MVIQLPVNKANDARSANDSQMTPDFRLKLIIIINH